MRGANPAGPPVYETALVSEPIMKRIASLLVATALCACSGRDSNQQDSALTRDLALASQAQAAQPQFQDTAPAQTGAPASAPRRISNAPKTRTIPRTTPAA